jgi:hypothetical protein
MHVVLQFRMGMKISPPCGDFLVQVGDAVDNRHCNVLVSRLTRQRA